MAFLDSTMSENSFLFTSESVGEVSKSDFEKLTKLEKVLLQTYCAIKEPRDSSDAILRAFYFRLGKIDFKQD